MNNRRSVEALPEAQLGGLARYELIRSRLLNIFVLVYLWVLRSKIVLWVLLNYLTYQWVGSPPFLISGKPPRFDIYMYVRQLQDIENKVRNSLMVDELNYVRISKQL